LGLSILKGKNKLGKAYKSGFQSFVSSKCPQCRKGDVFQHSVWKIHKFQDTFEHCQNCNVKFESEPGFFWGAMYFSYAINVAIAVITGFIFFYLNPDPDMWLMVGTVFAIVLMFLPFIFRFSRLLMMYIFAPYRHFNDRL
jgi:uncharacterized protein (DUF983 family)